MQPHFDRCKQLGGMNLRVAPRSIGFGGEF